MLCLLPYQITWYRVLCEDKASMQERRRLREAAEALAWPWQQAKNPSQAPNVGSENRFSSGSTCSKASASTAEIANWHENLPCPLDPGLVEGTPTPGEGSVLHAFRFYCYSGPFCFVKLLRLAEKVAAAREQQLLRYHERKLRVRSLPC